MSRSRRDFLSGVGAVAVAATARLRASRHEMRRASTDIDHRVAEMFCAAGDYDFLDVDTSRPHVAAILYGLVCLDRRGQELLIPNTKQVTLPSTGLPMMEHHPRIWSVVAGSLTAWDVPGYHVRERALNDQGVELTLGDSMKAQDHLKRRPWAGMRWVRNIRTHTGRSLLPAAARNDTARVTTRISLPGGRVTAVQPHSWLGSNTDWEVTTRSGTRVTQSTTDAMLWTRQLPTGTVELELTFQPMDASVPAMASVRLPIEKMSLRVTLAVTHAHPGKVNDPGVLEDTCAFALLLQGITPAQYPIPKAVPGARDVSGSGVSGDDGHCEPGWG